MKKLLVLMTTSFALSGCLALKNVQEDWQCKINQGKGCQSISTADGTDMGKPKPVRMIELTGQMTGNAKDERTDEYIGTIYFYPFVDSGGNYHESHKVKKVFIPSDWAR